MNLPKRSMPAALERVGDFLLRSSSCQPASGPEAGSQLNAQWDLDQFLRLHPPRAQYPQFDPDSERSPILLTIPRQRRIPIEWPVARSQRTLQPKLNYLRRFLERQWSDAAIGQVAQPFLSTPNALALSLVSRDLRFTSSFPDEISIVENDIDAAAHVIRVPFDDGTTRYFSLELIDTGLAPDFAASYEKSWANISQIREIFLKGAQRPPIVLILGNNRSIELDEPKAGPIKVPVSDQASLKSLLWSTDGNNAIMRKPIATGALSSWMTRDQARSFAEERWSVWLSDQTVTSNVFQGSAKPAHFANVSFKTIGKVSAKGVAALLPDPAASPASAASVEVMALGPAPDANDWILHSAGRFYRIVQSLSPGQVFQPADRASYEAAWQQGLIVGLEPLSFKGSNQAPDNIPTSYFEIVDLRPQVILEEYWKWSEQNEVEKAKIDLAAKVLDVIRAKDIATLTNDDITAASNLHETLTTGQYTARRALQTLKERASRLGYYLATGIDDEKINKKDAAGNPVSIDLVPGTLYKRFNVTATYSETVIEPWCMIAGHGYHYYYNGDVYYDHFCCRHFERTVVHQYDYLNYEPIRLAYEPWIDKRDTLQDLGFNCLAIHLADEGYVAEDGTPLTDVMARAAADESFRQSLAIFIPIYQDRLDQGRVLVQYLIAIRPSPGYSPSLSPQLFCDEVMSYRAQWSGIELNELLQSFSLAPGEDRTVTISRTVSQTTERVESITTILDVTQSQKLDLSSSLQTTLQNENTSKQTSSWNASAGGSYGGFSASGGASGSSEHTSRDYAENIRKQAMQSTREMRVNNKQEVKSTSTATTSVNVAESTTSKFSNINQGRSLNLMFFQVDNAYRAGLFLDDVQFLFTRSTPLIEGTNIPNPTRYRFEDLAKMLDDIAIDPAFNAGGIYDQDDIRRLYLRKALQIILEEYVEFPDEQGQVDKLEAAALSLLQGLKVATSTISSCSLSFAANLSSDGLRDAAAFLGQVVEPSSPRGQVAYVPVDQEIAAGVKLLRKLSYKDTPIDTHILLTPSGATYLDSIVGERPSTEDYSERMRALELRQREVEIERLRSAPIREVDMHSDVKK